MVGTIIAYLLIIALTIRARIRSGKKSKGRRGEKKVTSKLQILKKYGKFNVLNDLLLKRDDSHTSQIDHVVIGESGVFVIETKNYKGHISGDSWAGEWFQNIKKNEWPFENPLLQNKGHIKALKKHLNERFPDLKYHSLVVFPSRNLLGVDDARVIARSEIVPTILGYRAKALSPDEVETMTEMLRKANITSRKERKAHLKSVSKRQRQW